MGVSDNDISIDNHILVDNSIPNNLANEYNATREEEKRSHLCHAPFKSLRFSLSGNVLACCYNRQHSLGKYPENTLKEIWFGDKANQLKNKLIANDLTLGCQDCESNLNNKNFHAVGAKMYDYLGATSSGYPVMLDFELSNTCNLECIMCNGEYSSSIRKNRELKPPYPLFYDENFVSQLEEFIPHLQEARFVGGEPFLNEINFLIWEKIIELNPSTKITILTNGTILNSKIKTLLDRGNFHVSVSIDSLNKENYENIRQNANFEQVMANLDYFLNYASQNNRWINLNVCPIRQNWKEIPEFFKFGNRKNISIFLHSVKFPLSSALWNWGSEQLKEIIAHSEGVQLVGETSIQKENVKRYGDLINQVKNWHEAALSKENKPRSPKIESLNELCREFLSILEKQLVKSTLQEPELIQVKMKKYTEILSAIENNINDEPLMLSALNNLIVLPPNLIISELEISSIDRLVERFKLAASTAPLSSFQ